MARVHCICFGLICRVCGGPFVASRSDALVCGENCKKKRQRRGAHREPKPPVYIGCFWDKEQALAAWLKRLAAQ